MNEKRAVRASFTRTASAYAELFRRFPCALFYMAKKRAVRASFTRTAFAYAELFRRFPCALFYMAKKRAPNKHPELMGFLLCA